MTILWLLTLTTAQAATDRCWRPTTRAGRRHERRGLQALEDGGDAEAAQVHFAASLAAEPDCGATQQHLGALLLAAGEHDAARAMLTPAMARFPDEPGVLRLLAEVASAQGQQDSARMMARQALALDPADFAALATTHRILADEGAWPSIDHLLEQATPHHPAADMACLRSLSAAGQGDIEGARDAWVRCQDSERTALIADVETAIGGAIHSEIPDTLQTYAINERMRLGDWQGALDLIAAMEPPVELSVRIVRGTCSYNLGQLEAALEDLSLSVSDNPRVVGLVSHPGSYRQALRSAARMYTRALAELGRLEEAAGALVTVRERYGAEYDFHRTEINLLARDGQAIQAAVVWLDARQRWPDEPDLTGALSDVIQADPGVVSEEMWSFLARSSRPEDHFMLATRRLQEGDIPGCLTHAEQALRLGMVGVDALNLSYHCAVLSGDLDRAESLRVQLGASVMPMIRLQHALLAGEQGQTETARALLLQTCPQLPAAERARCEAVLESLP